MEFPCVHLDDIAGLEEAKDALLKASRQHLSAGRYRGAALACSTHAVPHIKGPLSGLRDSSFE